jgi:hypothetical protein
LLLKSYLSDYVREEIAAEALVRNLPAFSNFLEVAALGDSEVVSYSTIARDCGVSSPTVKEYFQVLSDTLMGTLLPPFVLRPKRRTVQAHKFYFNDVGIVNILAKRGEVISGSAAFGKAQCAIEAKSSRNITSDHLKGIRAFTKEYPEVQQKICVCCESVPRVTEDGIQILPWQDFVTRLWAQKYF